MGTDGTNWSRCSHKGRHRTSSRGPIGWCRWGGAHSVGLQGHPSCVVVARRWFDAGPLLTRRGGCGGAQLPSEGVAPDGQAVDEHRALDQEEGCGGAQLLSEGAAPDGQAVVEQGSRQEQGAKKFGGTAVQGDACSR